MQKDASQAKKAKKARRPKSFSPDMQVLPLADFAKKLGVNYTTVWRWCTRGVTIPRKTGKTIKLKYTLMTYGKGVTERSYQRFLTSLRRLAAQADSQIPPSVPLP